MKKNKPMIKIKCECGEEILMVPDLKEMGLAIENHVDLHLQNLKGPAYTPADAEQLRDMLIAQVLKIASQLEDEKDQ